MKVRTEIVQRENLVQKGKKWGKEVSVRPKPWDLNQSSLGSFSCFVHCLFCYLSGETDALFSPVIG